MDNTIASTVPHLCNTSRHQVDGYEMPQNNDQKRGKIRTALILLALVVILFVMAIVTKQPV